MTLYEKIDPLNEGDLVQYVGNHATRPYDAPTVGFREASADNRIAELEAERDALLEACELALQGYIDILQADLLPDHKAETQMVVNTLDAAIRKAKGEGDSVR